jgi:hypothetical protein
VIEMKRLYKIILLFVLIFLAGIYFTLKSIDMAFTPEDKIENVSMKPSYFKILPKVKF